MLMNWTGVHIFQFILRAAQYPCQTRSPPTSNKFMTKKKSARKAGATTRRSRRRRLTTAKGTSDGISCSRYR
uniref:Uncharacterized protein n=1 Tax=Varanus komodoensis TaxID=61221 RepID=A0A8D2JFU5_VARKO